MTTPDVRSAGTATAQSGNVVAELMELLPAGRVVLDPDVVEAHSRDHATAAEPGVAAALVRPRSTEEVSQVLEACHRSRVPVVPQGARTGLSGGAVATDGSIVLDLSLMNQILEIDPVERIAVVQSGVSAATLKESAAHHGLWYPPDPSSFRISTLGGNVATDAGGLCCVKYGTTSTYVRALEVVLSDGRVMRTGRRTAKGVAGYDLTALMCGSEGTLGVITEITVALVPVPEAALVGMALIETTAQAAEAVAAVMSTHQPSMLEMLDPSIIRAINAHSALDLPDVGAILLLQSDRGDRAAEDLASFEQAMSGHGLIEFLAADDAAESDLLLEARRQVHYAFEKERGAVLVDDVCVPRARLADLVAEVSRIGAEHNVISACHGHAGDGNMHPVLAYDPTDLAEAGRAHAAAEDIMAAALALGGTITGEHGVGTLKSRALGIELDAASADVQRNIKRAMDPYAILNPGKVLDLPNPEGHVQP